ncbi:hypothetical protein [Limnospira platensis]|uniref:hypothetical protein n=1 Tax=Limnospira platensis TaxID=118562 RepID=UPI0001D0EB1F|nr:hypothetical protein AP285_16165 [Arthrospira platensis YZ]KDR57648.1 hypothetical protein APPUASWS_009640 [Arthrospira platensis str. Paraca]MDF2213155.1 hypothetical protein [Arthrospira platensis NCB002]QQW27141.1 hypothetical protein AP9108_17585 [Arthrospira sp. PCC 9108]BAI91496.1 hypothetical protein NIES39_J04490 [Arthrospira platensis NIES-39]
MSFSVYSSIVNLDTLNISSKIQGTPTTTAISLTANTITEVVPINATSNGRTVFVKNRSNTNVHLIFDPTGDSVSDAAFSVKPGDTISITWGRTELQAIAESSASISVTIIEYIDM